MTTQPINQFYRTYRLAEARKISTSRAPEAHQAQALQAIHAGFESRARPFDGGLLVLPTGGGKTFTAARFLCSGPLSRGYKVLWLAHTHHLLEQAFMSLGREVDHIHEPKASLNVRVVSGTDGHSDVRDIKPGDDVIIATLQTVSRAYPIDHPALMEWLATAGDKLVVVFDEAHHAPAYSYRTLLTQLGERQHGLYLLGLTATPVYSDEQRSGWLSKLFPRGILYQITAQKLMAAGILAQPVFEEHNTQVSVQFDERDYKKWLGTYRDLPEEIVSQLALNRERNQLIASTYLQERARYGKTIIFVDRWYQCEQLREMLTARGVKADVIYSHTTQIDGGPEVRNRRTADDNHEVLERFRNGELEVLINVRMLTEGTDVPDVSTVFLTRQTTSHILLTQMIGRALRGQRFGGTDKAYVVSFNDNWKHLINWAEYEVDEGETLGEQPVTIRRPPMHLVSIALVRDLARMMDSGNTVTLQPFLSLLPIGWYRTDYLARVEDSDDLETVVQMVMIFEHEREAYQRFIATAATQDLRAFGDESVQLTEQRALLEEWRAQFFADAGESIGEDRVLNLYHIVRHMAYHDGQAPAFFLFEERAGHDLDQIAKKIIAGELSRVAEQVALNTEYRRSDRYWSVLYPNFLLFKSQCDACINRILSGGQPLVDPPYENPEGLSEREPSQEVKDQVLHRDQYRCLSCGEQTRRLLRIDHVAPYYLGGSNALGNLQTLCDVCNRHKGISEINFLYHETTLTQAPTQFPSLEPPSVEQAVDRQAWEQFVRRSVNFFYQCAAVQEIQIDDGPDAIWTLRLWTNNNPQWLAPFAETLVQQIQARRFEGGADGPAGLIISAPDLPQLEIRLAAPTPQPKDELAYELAIVTATNRLFEISLAELPVSGRGAFGRPLLHEKKASRLTTACLARADQSLVAISSAGKLYAIAAPAAERNTPDEPIVLGDVAGIAETEALSVLASVPAKTANLWAVVLTSSGMIKRLSLTGFHPATLRGRVIAPGGEVVAAHLATMDDDLMIVTGQGYAIRFPVAEVPELGAGAAGVRAIKLDDRDTAVALAVVPPSANTDTLCVVTEVGQAKRTPIGEYRAQGRGGVGIATSSVSGIVAALVARAGQDVVALTRKGKASRVRMADIPLRRRATSGVYAVSVEQRDRLVTAFAVPGSAI